MTNKEFAFLFYVFTEVWRVPLKNNSVPEPEWLGPRAWTVGNFQFYRI